MKYIRIIHNVKELKTMEKKLALELVDFLYDSPSACHGVKATQKILDKNGFVEIKETDKWDLQAKGKYYVIKNDSALIAFEVGTGNIEETGFRLIGAHTDVPGFRIKPNPQMISEGKYVKLNTEVYGGPILYTWYDRPLSIAGKVSIKGVSPLKPETRLININKPLFNDRLKRKPSDTANKDSFNTKTKLYRW